VSADNDIQQDSELRIAGGIEFIYWLSLVGKSRTTGYLWRKKGPNGESPRIKTLNIDGKNYVRAEEVKRFWDRAEAGEFAKEAVVPARCSAKPKPNGDSKGATSV
jgi:hypothetical protein